MCSMPRILLACVTGASALHVVNDVMDEQRILLLGCSLDRNAVFGFCEHHGDHNMTYTTTRPLNSSWCRSSELNVRMSYVFHPGVGVNGDLDEPSFSNGPSTGQILKHFAKEASMVMLKAEPTLIVVDSSLWDLASWNVGPLHGHTESWVYTHTPIAKNVTKERVQQWCEHDLLTLLSEVSANFIRAVSSFGPPRRSSAIISSSARPISSCCTIASIQSVHRITSCLASTTSSTTMRSFRSKSTAT